MAIDLYGIGVTAYCLAMGMPTQDELKKLASWDVINKCAFDTSKMPNGAAKHLIRGLMSDPANRISMKVLQKAMEFAQNTLKGYGYDNTEGMLDLIDILNSPKTPQNIQRFGK